LCSVVARINASWTSPAASSVGRITESPICFWVLAVRAGFDAVLRVV
jgi:hypothetical protein